MKKKWLAVSFLVFTLLTLPVFRFVPNVNANPDWLTGWQYRKSHVINSASGTGTNYQVRIKVHYGSGTDSGEDVYLNSHCRTDFGDVRFTDDDGATELDYWMEEKVDSDYAVFWVEVADDLSSSSATIYVYYGKSDATYTDPLTHGEDTFLLFDDFEDGSIDSSKWSEISGYTNGAVEESNGKIKVTGGAGAWEGWGSKSEWTGNISVMGKVLFYTDANNYQIFGIDDRAYDTGNYDGTGLDTARIRYVSAKQFEVRRQNDINTASRTTSLDTFRRVEIKWILSKVTFDIDNGLETSTFTDTSYIPHDSCGVRLWVYGNSYYVQTDWLAVRKYVDPEPAHGSWGTEETGETQEKSFTLTETTHATATHILTEEKRFTMTSATSATSMPTLGIEKWLLFQISPAASVYFILAQEKQFTLTPTASATSTLAWGIEKLLQFQTSPSASSQFTLLKEGFYTATELVNTLASYILGKETTLTVKEYVKTETAQANAAYTMMLEKLFFQTATPAASALANMAKEATQVLHEFLETAHAQATLYKRLYTPTAETNLALVLAAFAAAIAIVALSLTITKKD